ncbi:hypothetical protein ABK040_006109 [Willaertia magna]
MSIASSESNNSKGLIAPNTLVVFDFDSTLVKEESLVTLLEYALQDKFGDKKEIIDDFVNQIKEITNQGIKGEIDMKTSYSKRLSIALPNDKHVEKYLNRPLEQIITPQMDLVIKSIKENYPFVPIHVISQGPQPIVEFYSEKLFNIPKECVHAVNVVFPKSGSENGHEYVQNDEMLTKGKTATLEQLVKQINETFSNSKVEHIIVVGDGVSDMNMKHNGPATVAIGFGANLLFQKTKELSDYFVTDCNQLQQILIEKLLRDFSVFNFFPGPGAMPTSVLSKLKDNLLCFDKGISIMEYSHRAQPFVKLVKTVEAKLRTLVGIPDDYKILFMQGGSSLQFTAIPLNLCEPTDYAAFVDSGAWSKKAYTEAKAYLGDNAISINFKDSSQLRNHELYDKFTYIHYCDNETIHGIEKEETFLDEIANDGKVLVCDMSSNFLSRPVNIKKFGIVYACAQKNFGLTGLTLVVIRKDLIKEKKKNRFVPTSLDFKVISDADSLHNTPVTLAFQLSNLILDWIEEKGGLKGMDELAKKRSELLYNAIKESPLLECVNKELLSRMNVVFKMKSEYSSLESTFIKEGEKVGLIGLAGYRTVGGFRVSLYNAMTLEGVNRLITFIKAFDNKYHHL